MHGRVGLVALLALPGLILGATTGVTMAAFRATTSNQSTFSAAASFPVSCPTTAAHYVTGWEPGLLTADLEWQLASGTAETIDSSVRRTGAHSARVAKTSLGAAAVSKSSVAAPTRTAVLSLAIRLESLPAADATLAYVTTADTSFRLGYQASTQRLTTRWALGTATASTAHVAPRTWYSIDLRIDTSATTRRADWKVDGVSQTPVSSAGLPADQLGIHLGSDQLTEVFTANYDDFFESRTAADYPIGPVAVRGLRPNGMGTHSGAGSFQDDDLTAVDAGSYARLDDSPMNSAADGIRQVTASAASYIELALEDTDAMCSKGAQAVVAQHRTGLGTSHMKTSIVDGPTERVVFSGDPGGTAVARKKAVIAPSSSWSRSAINGLVARIGHSTDVSPVPIWDALVLEVAAPDTASAPGAGPSCTEANAHRLIGFEPGVLNLNLFDGVQGAVTIDAAVPRSGRYSVKATKTAGVDAYVGEEYELGTRASVVTVGLRLESLPAADVVSLLFTSNDGSLLRLGYRAASQSLTLGWSAGAAVVSSMQVVAGTWYSLELRINTGTNPRTAEWRIGAQDQTTVSSAEPAGDQLGLAFGSYQAADVFTAHYDDYVHSRTLADYPIGPLSVRPMRPDGMDASSGAANFRNDDGTAIGPATFARLDDSYMSDAYESVRQTTSSATSYLEVSLEDTTETCVKGVQATVAVRKVAKQATNMKASVFDGTVERVVHTGDPGGTTTVQRTALIAPATSWSQGALNALVARIGYSSSAGQGPTWDSLVVEYAVPHTGPGPVSYAGTVLADGPVGYWRMGDRTQSGVDEARTSDGTYTGAYALGLPGALATDDDTSADFGGSTGSFVVPHAAALGTTSQVSIEAWVKPDTVAGNRYVLTKGTGNLYYLYLSDNRLVFGVRSSGVYVSTEAVGVVTTGAWQHIVGTFNGSTLTLYRNGVKVVETTPAGCPCTIDTSLSPLYVAAFESTSGFFDGGLDEIALYRAALTPAQVQAHYARR